MNIYKKMDPGRKWMDTQVCILHVEVVIDNDHLCAQLLLPYTLYVHIYVHVCWQSGVKYYTVYPCILNCFMQIWIITNKQICICIFKKKYVFVLSIYRHLAYRRFVRWIWHCLGKNNRKILPSCVVNKIRTAFPSQQYCGFKYPSWDSEVNICGIIFLLINSYMYLKQTTMHLVSSQMIVK